VGGNYTSKAHLKNIDPGAHHLNLISAGFGIEEHMELSFAPPFRTKQRRPVKVW
jgi:hypothetical protein